MEAKIGLDAGRIRGGSRRKVILQASVLGADKRNEARNVLLVPLPFWIVLVLFVCALFEHGHARDEADETVLEQRAKSC